VTLDRTLLSERVGKLSKAKMELLLSGIDVVLRPMRVHFPLPATEWRRLDVLGSDKHAGLVGVWPSSVARYAQGER